jgi:uncharacterized protein
MHRRHLLLLSAFLPSFAFAQSENKAAKLIAAARAQVGRTVVYDPAYVQLDYPNGDVPEERGVCTDVVIRAYRAGLGIDLQQGVHEDMKTSFSAYPKTWGLKKPDTNIDHRRVPNLQTYFKRRKAAVEVSHMASAYAPGDLVTMMLPGHLPHIGIVSDTMTADRTRPLIIHNIGAGTQEEDILFRYPLTGRYRYALA